MVEVTEADREAAAQLADQIQEWDIAKNIRAQKRDPYVWCQAFATHRIEAAKAERDRLRDIANSPALEIAARKTGHGALTIAVIAPALADALESQP